MRYDVLTQDLWALPICFTRCIGSLLRASTTNIFLFATVICVSTWDFTKVAFSQTKKTKEIKLHGCQTGFPTHFPPAVICCDFSNNFSNTTSRRVDEAMQGTKVLCRERQGNLAKLEVKMDASGKNG